jgi:hypothetical protein
MAPTPPPGEEAHQRRRGHRPREPRGLQAAHPDLVRIDPRTTSSCGRRPEAGKVALSRAAAPATSRSTAVRRPGHARRGLPPATSSRRPSRTRWRPPPAPSTAARACSTSSRTTPATC